MIAIGFTDAKYGFMECVTNEVQNVLWISVMRSRDFAAYKRSQIWISRELWLKLLYFGNWHMARIQQMSRLVPHSYLWNWTAPEVGLQEYLARYVRGCLGCLVAWQFVRRRLRWLKDVFLCIAFCPPRVPIYAKSESVLLRLIQSISYRIGSSNRGTHCSSTPSSA